MLIALDISMALKMADEVWNGLKPGIAISALKRSGPNSVAIARSKYVPCTILVPSFNYFASVVTEIILILCFYTNQYQNL